jgi:hypothetical protein
MKEQRSRRLRLSRETLRVLSSGELATVNGGVYSQHPETDYECAKEITAAPPSECYTCGGQSWTSGCGCTSMGASYAGCCESVQLCGPSNPPLCPG